MFKTSLDGFIEKSIDGSATLMFSNDPSPFGFDSRIGYDADDFPDIGGKSQMIGI